MIGFSRSSFWSFGVALGFVLIGCGEAKYPASGKVTVKGGGPLTMGSVEFYSEKATGSGTLRDGGAYTISNLDGSAGLPAGKYKISLHGTSTGGSYDKPDEPVKRVIDEKYE